MMIIRALYDYYQILKEAPDIDIPEFGYSDSRVDYYLVISKAGELLDIVPLVSDNKKNINKIVPEHSIRARGIKPYFLCDNAKYVLGWDFDPKKNKATKDYFKAFTDYNLEILKDVDNHKSRAFKEYLEKWIPERAVEHPVVKKNHKELSKATGAIFLFKLDGEKGYIDEDGQIIAAWERYYESKLKEEDYSQCMITGEEQPIEATHPKIKGVWGSNSSGGTLVGVNKSAFSSYEKKQGYNSPIGKEAAFAYSTVLNHILHEKSQRIQLGDTTTVFWAEDKTRDCESLMMKLLYPGEENTEQNNPEPDYKTQDYVNNSLKRLRAGKPIQEKSDVSFCILGVSPNNARLAVRFWQVDDFGTIVENVWQHHKDMTIIKTSEKEEEVPIKLILNETIPEKTKKRESSPALSGGLMRSVFNGTTYPNALYFSMINRIRTDCRINAIRAGFIKAYLKRIFRHTGKTEKEAMINVSLDENNSNVAYRLGRLFSVLEKAQSDAADVKLNSTIKDRYFGTASASPRSIFPVLMKLTQHHISKSEWGSTIDRKIQDVLEGVDQFPSYLNSEEQGMFILGYNHQRADLYRKKTTAKEGDKE